MSNPQMPRWARWLWMHHGTLFYILEGVWWHFRRCKGCGTFNTDTVGHDGWLWCSKCYFSLPKGHSAHKGGNKRPWWNWSSY